MKFDSKTRWRLKRLTLPATKAIYSFQIASEKNRGLDFTQMVDNDASGIDQKEGNVFEATHLRAYPILRRICREASKADSILDVGCGKGGMLRFFVKQGFGRVDGLEYSERVGAIARKNLEVLGLAPSVKVYIANAAVFEGYDAYNWFYLYNPFPKEVMIQFAQRLEESWQRIPRKIRIIYFNPKHGAVLTQKGFMEHGYRKTIFEKIWGSFLVGVQVYEKG